MNWPPEWKGATLILAGHGSSHHPLGSKTVNTHAQAIRAQGLFAEVRTVFWKEPPRFASALDNLTTPLAYVVPLLAADGYITSEVLPKEIGFKDRRLTKGGTTTFLCKAIGTHPRLPLEVSRTVSRHAALAKLDGNQTTLLLIGHGNEKNPASANQTETVAEAVRATGIFTDVRTAFLDQKPYVGEWRNFNAKPTILAVPFMVSGGMHAAQDVPDALGILDKIESNAGLYERECPIGPLSIDGKSLYYCRPIGCEGFVARLALEQVLDAGQAA